MQNSGARLLEVLGGIAMYNDKGCEWNRHSAARIAEEQRKAQAEIEQLIIEIGEPAFPAEVLSQLRAGLASQDATDAFKLLVEKYIASPEAPHATPAIQSAPGENEL